MSDMAHGNGSLKKSLVSVSSAQSFIENALHDVSQLNLGSMDTHYIWPAVPSVIFTNVTTRDAPKFLYNIIASHERFFSIETQKYQNNEAYLDASPVTSKGLAVQKSYCSRQMIMSPITFSMIFKL